MSAKKAAHKQPTAITVAMVKDPEGTRWQAQVQIEYRKGSGTDALVFVENTPMHCLERAKKAIGKRCFGDGPIIVT
jgi:hypothetical protein